MFFLFLVLNSYAPFNPANLVQRDITVGDLTVEETDCAVLGPLK